MSAEVIHMFHIKDNYGCDDHHNKIKAHYDLPVEL